MEGIDLQNVQIDEIKFFPFVLKHRFSILHTTDRGSTAIAMQFRPNKPPHQCKDEIPYSPVSTYRHKKFKNFSAPTLFVGVGMLYYTHILQSREIYRSHLKGDNYDWFNAAAGG